MIPSLVLLAGLLAGPTATDPGYEATHTAAARASEDLRPASLLVQLARPLEFIRIVRFDVFREGELIPPVFNVFHWLTAPEVIRRELLLRPGDRYDRFRALESARNLRRLGIFQLVAIEPVQDAAGQLGLLVVTRDLWSLRLEQGFQFTGRQFDLLLLQLTERNLFGRNQQASLNFSLDPVTFRVGQRYFNRRIALGELQLDQGLDVIFKRDGRSYDGVDFTATVSRPLYNLGQRFAFQFPFRYLDRHARQIRAGQVVTWDDPATAEVEAVRRVWRQRYITDGVLGQVQLGEQHKHRIAAGLVFSHFENRPVAETALPAASADRFGREVLPRDLTEVAPRLVWTSFGNEFRTFQDLRSFGVSEDARLGLSSHLGLSIPLEALGSTYTAVAVELGLGWTGALGAQGLVDLLAAAEGRLEDGALINQEYLLRIRAATPPLGPVGRLVTRVDWLARAEDTRNRLLSLGGDNGLRGYPSQFFQLQGADRLRANLELRSRPVTTSFAQLGLVGFYDAGAVYQRVEDFVLRQSVGLGARVLFPQFNREVFRFDLGVPVDGSGFMLNFSAGGTQAVPLTPEEDRNFSDLVGGFANQP